MKVRHFVSASSIILAAWLLTTFLWEVPADRYPALGRGSVPVTARAVPQKPANDRGAANLAMTVYQAQRADER